MSGCWAVWDEADAEPGWYDHGAHGGRAQMCNGHGSCVAAVGVEGGTAQCACDAMWSGAGCTVDMHQCGFQGAVQAYRDSVVGACLRTALDRAKVGGACPAAMTTQAAFTVTDVLSLTQAWQVCSLLSARLAPYDAGDPAQASHCASVAPPGHNGTAEGIAAVLGPGCDWTASIRHVFGHGTALGIPVRCVGYPCTPPGTFATAQWAELVPVAGVPAAFDARAACRRTQAASSERSWVATARDVDEVQRRQLRGHRTSRHTFTSVLWYDDAALGGLAWRTHAFLWVGEGGSGTATGAWQEFAPPAMRGATASTYLQPDAALPNTEPHFHSVVCIVQADYTPGTPRTPSTALEAGGATILLWLPV